MPTFQPATPSRSRTFVFQVLAAFLPMALLACGAAYYFYQSTQDRAAIHIRARETTGIELGQSAISNVLQETRRDLRLVSGHYALKNFLDQSAPGEMRDFEQDMLNLAAASRFYNQIRWLDETGMERMRVNFNNGNPVITPTGELQNKRDRYYFAETIKLERGEVYMSPLDLNVEHERIEIPHKPMLRIATPVFNSHGDKRGIVLLNYLGEELLTRFNKATADIADHVMLLNQDGYWLKSPKPDEAWGFMSGRDQLTLARRHPAAWQRILAADSGQFEDTGGLWTFSTIYPRLEEQKKTELNALSDRASFWKVVAHLPKDARYGSHPLLKPMLAALAVLLLLQFAGSWKLARVRRLRNEAQEQVQHTNRNLEHLVEERTAQLQADINLRKQIEDALRQSESKLATILDSVEAFIYIKDAALHYQYANRYVCKLFGKSLEEVTGQGDEVFFDADTAANLRENDRRVLEHGERIETEEVNTGKESGQTRTYLSVKLPLKGEDGVIYALCGISTDITERKRAEEALRESEEKLHLFIEHAPAALAMFDREMRYLAVSRRWMTDYGLDDEGGIIGRSHYEVFPEIPERQKTVHRRGLSGEVVRADDERFERFDGSVQWLRWEVRPWYTASSTVGGIVIFTEDITGRKQAEDALHEKEFMLSESQRIAHVGSWQLDLPGDNIIRWSDETYRLYGVSPENFTPDQESFYALIHADDQAAMREWVGACLEGERPGELEFRTVLPDGKIRILSGRGDIQYDAENRPIRMAGTVQDITERRQADAALYESEQKFRGIFENARDGIVLIDCDNGLIANCNHEFEKQTGRTLEQLQHTRIWELRPGDKIKSARKRFQKIVEAAKGEADDLELQKPDGTIVSVEFRATIVTIGGVRYVQSITRDITGRRQAEEKLRTLSAAVEQAPISVVISDLEANILYVNPRFTEVTGYSADEAAGQNPRMLQSTLTPKETYRDMWATLTGGRVWQGELINRRKNGEIYWEDAHIAPVFDAAGVTTHYVGVKVDVTERKKTEARLLKLNRVYTVLSNINQAIVRLRDIDMLFCEACRIAVEDGGFRMAWIGVPDQASGELRPVAHAGMTQDYLDNLHISLANDEHGRGPTGTAFREGRPVYCNDIERDPRMALWRMRALELGYRSSIAMPLMVKGAVRGIYTLYAGQADFFNDEELKLLDELAGDIAFAMDVAETEAERSRSEERLRQAAAVFECTREGVMVTDAGLRILMVNRAFSELTGYTEAEALGGKPSLLSSGRQGRDFYTGMWTNLNATGHWQGEIWNRRKNGEIYPELLSISAITDDSGQVNGYVGVFADISKLRASESELEFLAHHDPLTRLPNRLLLLSRLKHGIGMAQRENRQLALLMLDLDRFKDVNDSFGHMAGDELLQQVGGRLMTRLRDVDTVCRLGGDEFTVLLEDIARPEDAARVANEIIAALSEPWQLANGAEVRIGASVGISLFPQHGNTAAKLLQQADAALYQAKAEGRGRFTYFTENLTRAARERIELEARLRRAIAQNELRVYYQPQVDIASARIIGAEALVRWQDPLEGLIPPGRFIPVAEATGLISAIGEWVLKETCLQGRRWIEAGLPPLTLAVNVSPHQFLSTDLFEVVSRTLAETGFSATCLELELTESALMDRQQEAVDMLNRLRAIGVRLAIDDFGTGYSSLAYLKRFPLDVLKIDKSFVDDIPGSQDDREIVAAIVAMGHTLRFKVLAEGVETLEQLAFLQGQGCDSYQGYLKSPPLPPDAFAKLLAESRLE